MSGLFHRIQRTVPTLLLLFSLALAAQRRPVFHSSASSFSSSSSSSPSYALLLFPDLKPSPSTSIPSASSFKSRPSSLTSLSSSSAFTSKDSSRQGRRHRHAKQVESVSAISDTHDVMAVSANGHRGSSQPLAAESPSPTSDVSMTTRAKFKLTASERDKKLLDAVEKLFLKNAGLSGRPKITDEYAVPEYMMDLYRQQVKRRKGPSTFLNLKGKGLIEANTVRSFVHEVFTSTATTIDLTPLAEGNLSKISCEGNLHHGSGHCHGQSLYPVTRAVNQPEALQLLDTTTNPVVTFLKHRNVGIAPLTYFSTDLQQTFDDLELSVSTAKPVAFTCDDILVDSVDSCQNNPKDMTWERASVRVVYPFLGLNDCKDLSHQKHQNLSHVSSNHLYFVNHFEEDFCSCPLSDSDNFHTFLFSSLPSQDSKGGETPKDGPSAEQLHNAREKIEKTIPHMFNGRYDYSLLHKDVVFENNLFGSNKIQRGVNAYAMELLKIRFRFYARYTSTHTEILNVTTQEQNGLIRIHWRLKGLPQSQVLKFWRLFQSRQEISKDDWEWIEAFSYFHVGKDGLVHKHRIDRMLPDNEEPDKLSLRLTKLLNPAKPLVS